jgi:hypothetical protein
MNCDRGVSSVQFVLASALGLFLFVALANLVVVQYGRGAVQSALEQGARAGSVRGEPSACEETAEDVLSQLLGGRMSDDLAISCRLVGISMVASGVAVFPSWTPLASDFQVELTSEAVIEPPP